MDNETVVPENETKRGFIKRAANAVSESSFTAKVLLVGGLVGCAVMTYAVRNGAGDAQSESETPVEEIN